MRKTVLAVSGIVILLLIVAGLILHNSSAVSSPGKRVDFPTVMKFPEREGPDNLYVCTVLSGDKDRSWKLDSQSNYSPGTAGGVVNTLVPLPQEDFGYRYISYRGETGANLLHIYIREKPEVSTLVEKETTFSEVALALVNDFTRLEEWQVLNTRDKLVGKER